MVAALWLWGSTSSGSLLALPPAGSLPVAEGSLELSAPAVADQTLPLPEPERGARALRADPASDYLLRLPYGREIRATADVHALDALLVAAVVEVESDFRADAVSSKGAVGLMQLMPAHLEGAAQPFDPQTNLDRGARFLAGLSLQYRGDLDLALAAYHAGPGAVARFGGIPPYRSTQSYVARVRDRYAFHRQAVAASDGLARPATVIPLARSSQRGS